MNTMQSHDAGELQSRGLLTRKTLATAIVFGGAAWFTILANLHVRIPGTGSVTDPREVFVTIGAALTGPVGGAIIGLLASLSDPNPNLRLYVAIMHIVGSVWIGWSYKRLVHDRMRMPGMLLGWIGILFAYYFLFPIPVLLFIHFFFPTYFLSIVTEPLPVLEAIAVLFRGWMLEFVMTTLATSVILAVLPRNYRMPLWHTRRDRPAEPPLARPTRRILGIRLTLWFLLLSLLPLTIAAIFIHTNLKVMVLEQTTVGDLHMARYLARLMADSRGFSPRDLTGIQSVGDSLEWFALDSLNQYVAHDKSGRIGMLATSDFPAASLRALRYSTEGYVEDDSTGTLLVYTHVPGMEARVVVMRPLEDVLTSLRTFERSSLLRLAAALILMSITSGTVIWLIVGGPMRNLAVAVEQFGRGDREVRVDTRSMADEIETLGHTFNEMAENLGILHAGLEQEIKDRRVAEHALRESEQKFQQMAELLPQPVFETDTEGILTFANRAAFDTFRYSHEEFEHGVKLLDIVAPQDRDRATETIRRILLNVRQQDNEFVLNRRDGSQFPALVYATGIYRNNTPVGVRGIAVDITEQKRAIREKEALLKEIHHRVKNNLQIISSLLNLQAGGIFDPRDLSLFQESESRVRSMALIHERLYKSEDFTRIDFREYVESLVMSLFHTYAIHHVTYHAEIQDVRLSIDTAIPCGLMINELMTNALKHAFPDGRKGKIDVTVAPHADGMVMLEVRDDGIGLPADVTPDTVQTLGLHLVTLLTNQLGGRMEIRREDGTAVRVIFPAIAAAPPLDNQETGTPPSS